VLIAIKTASSSKQLCLIKEKVSLESSGYKKNLKLEMTESTLQKHAEVLLLHIT